MGLPIKIDFNISKQKCLPFIEFLEVLYSFIAKVNLIFRKDLQNIAEPIFLRHVTEFHFISFFFSWLVVNETHQIFMIPMGNEKFRFCLFFIIFCYGYKW